MIILYLGPSPLALCSVLETFVPKDDIIFRAFVLGLSALENFVPKDDVIFRAFVLGLSVLETFVPKHDIMIRAFVRPWP